MFFTFLALSNTLLVIFLFSISLFFIFPSVFLVFCSSISLFIIFPFFPHFPVLHIPLFVILFIYNFPVFHALYLNLFVLLCSLLFHDCMFCYLFSSVSFPLFFLLNLRSILHINMFFIFPVLYFPVFLFSHIFQSPLFFSFRLLILPSSFSLLYCHSFFLIFLFSLLYLISILPCSQLSRVLHYRLHIIFLSC